MRTKDEAKKRCTGCRVWLNILSLVYVFLECFLLESPLRVLVEERACQSEFGPNYEPTSDGVCACRGLEVATGNCVAYYVLLPSIILPVVFLVLVAAHLYVQKKRKESDSLWTVDLSDLKFDDKVVLGRGTFGEVLLAEYRGTQVAVKRVLPPKKKDIAGIKTGTRSSVGIDLELGQSDDEMEVDAVSHLNSTVVSEEVDEEQSPQNNPDAAVPFGLISGYRVGTEANKFLRGKSLTSSVDFKQSTLSKSKGFGFSGSAYAKLKADFIIEMRLLSKVLFYCILCICPSDFFSTQSLSLTLPSGAICSPQLRHPCITTIMGAVIDSNEPLLVLEFCEHGSLYDLLHNETLHIEGELLLPVLRDICSGVRFLHSGTPPVIHGDLKSQNVRRSQACL